MEYFLVKNRKMAKICRFSDNFAHHATRDQNNYLFSSGFGISGTPPLCGTGAHSLPGPRWKHKVSLRGLQAWSPSASSGSSNSLISSGLGPHRRNVRFCKVFSGFLETIQRPEMEMFRKPRKQIVPVYCFFIV